MWKRVEQGMEYGWMRGEPWRVTDMCGERVKESIEPGTAVHSCPASSSYPRPCFSCHVGRLLARKLVCKCIRHTAQQMGRERHTSNVHIAYATVTTKNKHGEGELIQPLEYPRTPTGSSTHPHPHPHSQTSRHPGAQTPTHSK